MLSTTLAKFKTGRARLRQAKQRNLLTAVCVGVTALVALLHFFDARFDRLESWARDWLATNPAGRKAAPNPEIVFLGLDQSSMDLDAVFADDLAKSPTLQLMKQGFPWNRAVYAHIASRLLDAGARVVVFDLRFPAPRDGDEEFRAALEKYADRIVIGSNLVDHTESADVEQSTASHKPAHELPSRSLLPEGAHDDARIGFINVNAEEDKVVRSVLFRTTRLEYAGWPPADGEPELLSLAARALEKSGHCDVIPVTRKPVAIRFTEGIFTRSLFEIFVENVWAAPPFGGGRLFRGKIVLVGAAGNQAEDRLQTPFGTVLGPSIHLSAINAALSREFLHVTTPAENLALIVCAGALAWVFGAFIRAPLGRLGALAAALLLYYGAAQTFFNGTGLSLLLVSPMLALAASGVTWTAWEAALEFFERQRTRRLMERYVSKDIVRELLDNRASFLHVLGGVRRNVTVMFSDLRGFTSRTEDADPHALVAQLNEYFNEMVRIVFANHGTLDKFMGDAVMAHWGSIVSEGEKTDARRAVKTALEMRQALAALNAGWRERGIEPVAFGIGINHGEVIAGNLGSTGEHEKQEFTVIGDAVNTASRLEGVTKAYRLDLVIGELVEPLVREDFLVRSVDLITVKGKTRPVAVFTVLGERNGSEPPWLAKHEEAVRLYRAAAFQDARAAWSEVLAQAPGDALAVEFIRRCTALLENPPEGRWSGVFEMTSK